MSDLFEIDSNANAPLAQILRPNTLGDVIGQSELFSPGAPLRKMIELDLLTSAVFWGPPGTGKTTIANIIAHMTKANFVEASGITSTTADFRKILAKAKDDLKFYQKRTILFIDEIHHLNKSQQDIFLHSVETGEIILIGATTENPSFNLNNALLSRSKVFVFKPLTHDELRTMARKGCEYLDKKRQNKLQISDEIIDSIIGLSLGDARRLLNHIEIIYKLCQNKDVCEEHDIEIIIQKDISYYDKDRDEHYNHISALHKSMRGSDPDAAVYYTCKMIDGGDAPLYIVRRLIRFASEDIGNADPQALVLANAVKDTIDFLGEPECYVAIVQLAIYLACAPKSNASYMAYNDAMGIIKKMPNLPVPLHIRNPDTKLMKELGYGKGYDYPHNHPNAIAMQEYLPDELLELIKSGKLDKIYNPVNRGMEKLFAEKLKKIDEIKRKK